MKWDVYNTVPGSETKCCERHYGQTQILAPLRTGPKGFTNLATPHCNLSPLIVFPKSGQATCSCHFSCSLESDGTWEQEHIIDQMLNKLVFGDIRPPLPLESLGVDTSYTWWEWHVSLFRLHCAACSICKIITLNEALACGMIHSHVSSKIYLGEKNQNYTWSEKVTWPVTSWTTSHIAPPFLKWEMV